MFFTSDHFSVSLGVSLTGVAYSVRTSQQQHNATASCRCGRNRAAEHQAPAFCVFLYVSRRVAVFVSAQPCEPSVVERSACDCCHIAAACTGSDGDACILS
jgi:hypothetical protein